MIIEHAVPKTVTIQEIQHATSTDPALKNIIKHLTTGNWLKNNKLYNMRHQLSTKNNVLLFEN